MGDFIYAASCHGRQFGGDCSKRSCNSQSVEIMGLLKPRHITAGLWCILGVGPLSDFDLNQTWSPATAEGSVLGVNKDRSKGPEADDVVEDGLMIEYRLTAQSSAIQLPRRVVVAKRLLQHPRAARKLWEAQVGKGTLIHFPCGKGAGWASGLLTSVPAIEPAQKQGTWVATGRVHGGWEPP